MHPWICPPCRNGLHTACWVESPEYVYPGTNACVVSGCICEVCDAQAEKDAAEELTVH